MTCPKCGRKVDDQWKFCSYCGETMALVCPSCTVLNPADAMFCHDCGERLASQAAPQSPWRVPNQQRQTPSRTCPRCSTVNEPGSAYCYSCGLPLEDDAQRSQRARTYTAPVSGRPFRSLRTRANWTVALLIATCVAAGFSILAALNLLDMVRQVEAGLYVSDIDMDEAAFTLDGLAILLFAMQFPTAIAFLMWVYRTSKNLEPLGAHGQRFSPAWAVGWWFVPIMLLFRPYQVMAEIWRGSGGEALLLSGDNWQDRSVSPMLAWWWWIWIVARITSLVLSRVPDTLTTDGVSAFLLFWVVSDVLWIAAGILAIIIVRRITRRQREAHHPLAAG